MLRATLRNKRNIEKRKSIRQIEEEVKYEVAKKNAREPYDFDKKDIIAMIIAGYQMILPIVLVGVIIMIIAAFLFIKIYS